jgi:hypothetical protein
MPSETPIRRTGPLRNGNPRGDPNLAPRCGAKARTTGCPCRAPAMKNGRCRLHGGKSTGPRTAAGLARMGAAHTTHGYYTEEAKAARRRLNALIAEMRALLALRQVGAPPVAPPRLPAVAGKVAGETPWGGSTPCTVRTKEA